MKINRQVPVSQPYRPSNVQRQPSRDYAPAVIVQKRMRNIVYRRFRHISKLLIHYGSQRIRSHYRQVENSVAEQGQPALLLLDKTRFKQRAS